MIWGQQEMAVCLIVSGPHSSDLFLRVGPQIESPEYSGLVSTMRSEGWPVV